MIRIRPSTWRAYGRPCVSIVGRSNARPATTKTGRPSKRQKSAAIPSPAPLQACERYPLSKALRAIIYPSSGQPSLGHVRTQIVSPDLCGTSSSPLRPSSWDTIADLFFVDDVIKYIGPTLDKHKGCDILDINPGAGLWSQKLHEYLKPRSHVLLEPRHDRFKEFLDPLLTTPDSKYTLVQKDPCNLHTYQEMITEGVFPHQIVHGPLDPKAQQANDTLLVTGSLVWDPRLPGIGFDSMAKQLFHHFASGARHNEYFHAFGLVRTLLWVQNEDFSTIVAGSISCMHKANRILETTHNMTLVVNAERAERKTGRGSTGREPHHEIESLIRVLKLGSANGFTIPPHRRAPSHDFATEIDRLSDGTGKIRCKPMQDYLHTQHGAGKMTVGLIASSFADLHNDEKILAEKYPDADMARLSTVPRKEVTSLLKDHPGFKDFQPYLRKRTTIEQLQKLKEQVETCGDIGEGMYNLEVEILGMKDGPEKDALVKKLEELNRAWDKSLASLNSNHRHAVLNDTDERISLRTLPYPRIQWDRRPFEPLLMRSDEAWPQNRLSLISAEPIPSRSLDRPHDHFEWVHDFIYGLFNIPADAIDHALDKMQHGLSDIIKDCPSLKDPKQGGRLNMKQFRVRLLTVDMIDELVVAYRNWPFKSPGSDYPQYYRNRGSTTKRK